MMVRSWVRQLELLYRLYAQGLAEDNALDGYGMGAPTFQSPRFRERWAVNRLGFDPSFVAYFDGRMTEGQATPWAGHHHTLLRFPTDSEIWWRRLTSHKSVCTKLTRHGVWPVRQRAMSSAVHDPHTVGDEPFRQPVQQHSLLDGNGRKAPCDFSLKDGEG